MTDIKCSSKIATQKKLKLRTLSFYLPPVYTVFKQQNTWSIKFLVALLECCILTNIIVRGLIRGKNLWFKLFFFLFFPPDINCIEIWIQYSTATCFFPVTWISPLSKRKKKSYQTSADVPTGTGWSLSIPQEFFVDYKVLHLKPCHHVADWDGANFLKRWIKQVSR